METPQARATRCWRCWPARAIEILASKTGEFGLRCSIVRELIVREFGHALTASGQRLPWSAPPSRVQQR
jgi:hypothetical protein